MKKKIAIIIAAADGVLSLQTGVGIVVNFFFEAFDEIRRDLGEPDTSLYAMCPRVNKESPDFNTTAAAVVAGACARNKGRVIPLENISSGRSLNEIWKGTELFSSGEAWESCCKSLAQNVIALAVAYEKVYMLVHDTLFVNVSAYLPAGNIQVCWIPHSLGTLFADSGQTDRINFEKSKIVNLIARGDKIGCISNYTYQHLRDYYGINEQQVIPFPSGIYFNSVRYGPSPESKLFLSAFSIPAEKKLLFSWGRCSDQKGIDIIVKSFKSIIRHNPLIQFEWHLVLVCPTETSYPEYLAGIYDDLCELPPHTYTFIDRFQFRLQYDLLAYEWTRIILLCSRYESFGLSSIEALFKCHPLSTIVYSPLPTFDEVFEGAFNSVRLEENSEAVLTFTIFRIMEKSDKEQPHPARGIEMQNKFSLPVNYAIGISRLFNH